MRYSIHYITLHVITLHYITYITLHYVTLHDITLRYVALHYITLSYVTLHYVTLRYSIHYITLHCVTLRYSIHYITLRYVTLQYTWHYVTLRYITLHTYIYYIYYIYTYNDIYIFCAPRSPPPDPSAAAVAELPAPPAATRATELGSAGPSKAPAQRGQPQKTTENQQGWGVHQRKCYDMLGTWMILQTKFDVSMILKGKWQDLIKPIGDSLVWLRGTFAGGWQVFACKCRGSKSDVFPSTNSRKHRSSSKKTWGKIR